MSILPLDDRDGVIFYDGEIRPWRDAKLHVLTHSLHYGCCAFEGIRAYNGQIFKLTEHNQRLLDSAKMLDIHMDYTVEQLDELTRSLLQEQGLTDAYIRPVAWLGSETMSVATQGISKTHFAIAAWKWERYFSVEDRMKGIKLCTSNWKRPSPETAPTAAKAAGLYMICTLSKNAAEQKGFTDALMLDYRGYVAEATGANIFFVIDGALHTPTPDCFLDGITRRTVMELAQKRGIKVIERHILPEEIGQATEVFLTGTAAEVTPVGMIDELTFTPGKISKMLMDDYDQLVRHLPAHIAAE